MLQCNVKYVIYSENNGTMTKIKVKDLIDTHQTSFEDSTGGFGI